MQRSHAYPSKRCARGSAYLLAIIMLAVMGSLAVALASFTGMNVQQSDNRRQADSAQLACESGLAFMLLQLDHVRLPGTTSQANFIDNLHLALGKRLNGTANLGGLGVTKTTTEVLCPPIGLPEGSFTAQFTWPQASAQPRLVITGQSGQLTRRVEMLLDVETCRPGVFDYGLASRGALSIFGNARIVGVNSPSEANVLSATETASTAISIDGSAVVSGDLSVSGTSSSIAISGNPTIAGSKDPTVWAQHVHFGVEPPDFPATDTTGLASLAINVVDNTTKLDKDMVLNNIVIKAGTNPTFNNKVVLNGIVYIEAPNIVKFEGQATLNGFIVTQDNTLPAGQCQLYFAGGVEANGVEALPDTAEFAAVKQMPGTFVCAPGFGATFAGNFSAVNGSIAADQLTFTGTAEGTVRGSVIGLKDLPSQLGGTVDIFVDRKNAVGNPPGFLDSFRLDPVSASYRELLPGE